MLSVWCVLGLRGICKKQAGLFAQPVYRNSAVLVVMAAAYASIVLRYTGNNTLNIQNQHAT